MAALLATTACGGDAGSEAGSAPGVPGLLASSLQTPAADWPSNGRTPGEDRFSPLVQINDTNVHELGLAWSHDTGTNRGLEASPVVIDGVMYTTGSWSVVLALDAATGEELWRFDPGVAREYDRIACCDVVNRGVAVHDGKVYVGALDGRLIALDSYTGEPVWETLTVDQSKHYSVTGAPRVVKEQVIIGNGGAEFGVRGYVSAYDAGSGELNWRFYTVPGEFLGPGTPKLPPDEAAMARAAETWGPDTMWETGVGGTAWDSFAYDPELDLLYVGTGNGAPWNQQYRDPSGGDNLYLSSILALNPDDGTLAWHYQTTPGDSWDYTATQQMILADLIIDGALRQVIMQAPKNGFFYVLDRQTGELLSANNYVEVTWAEGIDMQTGRPIEAPNARYQDGEKLIQPSTYGGHNWQGMSFSPDTGLVYIPAQDFANIWEHSPEFTYDPTSLAAGAINRWSSVDIELPNKGYLLAWDPLTQEPRWSVEYGHFWNGGVLATAGNLVFQGTAAGDFVAYRASDGELLWQSWSKTGILAPPVSYEVDGAQYVAVMAGWGGAFAVGARSRGKIFAFALGGDRAAVESGRRAPREAPAPIEQRADAATIAFGKSVFDDLCAECHGGATTLPDLRYAEPRTLRNFPMIVIDGALESRGMPSFAEQITAGHARAIAAWVIAERNKLAR